MMIKFHGGECCGVKHISGFWGNPDQVVGEKAESTKRNHDKNGDSVRSDWDFCWEALPKQTYKERLVAYIDFLKRVRPSGAIELTLIDLQVGLYGWGPVLEELGFQKVVEFWNSNSANKVFVYYLVYGGKGCAYNAYNSGSGDEEDDDDYYDDDYYLDEEEEGE